MQIISGSSNKPLAKQIAKNTGYELLDTDIKNFSDGELRVEVKSNIGSDVIIVQSTSHPVNDHLIELLLLADTARRAGAKNIIAVIPYFGYSRQDRCTYRYGPISASLVVKLMEATGITKIITLDLHSKQLEGLFNIPVINYDSATLFFQSNDRETPSVIVSPDIGGVARARNFSSLIGTDLVIINKSRDKNNESLMSEIIGNVRGRKCIIVDDIVDSANTLCKAADLLRTNGATEIDAYITHAVLSGDAEDKITNSQINKIFVSNSIYHKMLPNKFNIINVDQLLSLGL